MKHPQLSVPIDMLTQVVQARMLVNYWEHFALDWSDYYLTEEERDEEMPLAGQEFGITLVPYTQPALCFGYFNQHGNGTAFHTNDDGGHLHMVEGVHFELI